MRCKCKQDWIQLLLELAKRELTPFESQNKSEGKFAFLSEAFVAAQIKKYPLFERTTNIFFISLK